MHELVPNIISVIIAIQIVFFLLNLIRMWQYRSIFSNHTSWELSYDENTDFVDGIRGTGNEIFQSIINSINKYLGNSVGSVIDYGLLKDAVDRHCDSVENDVATQTPIPLYLGLAGTMVGVIIGLWDLLGSNAIMTLMSSHTEEVDATTQNAAQGINLLLSGVAWAMIASICGIVLTTANSILFKSCKLREESGKNDFLAWMQSKLLPELPSDTSDTLNRLVRNLNEFNNTFESNTKNLGNALLKVNESYAIQAEVIKAIYDMDVMQMAKANVKVLKELQQCTDILGDFNKYLIEIEGYTDAIHRFETQFASQTERLHILEEIRDFFNTHKQAIAHSTADADKVLLDSLNSLRDHTEENVSEMHNRFVEQSNHFKNILREEKEAFEEFMKQMNAQFNAQMTKTPMLNKQLEEISGIPARLDKMIENIEKSNRRMAEDISSTLNKAGTAISLPSKDGHRGLGQTIPGWMKWAGVIALIIIAVSCLLNVVGFFIS